MGKTALKQRRKRIRRRRLAGFVLGGGLVFLLVLAILALATLSTSPSVAVQPRPTTGDVAAARQLYTSLRGSNGAITLDNRKLSGVAALARDALDLRRIAIDIEGESVLARASLPLPFSLWLNLSMQLEGEHDGFPQLACTAGRLTLPAFACRWGWDGVRALANWRGAKLPPLDDIVRHSSARDGRLLLKLGLPSRGDMVAKLARLRSEPIDAKQAEAVYCRLARGQQSRPVATLDGLLRRAFLPGTMRWDGPNNRAALVGLAILVAGDPANALLPGAQAMLQHCPRPAVAVTLRDRTDLAKHWTFSAGLTAAFGSTTALDMGEWKELDDSRAAGSGFSFVDLAADRSGVDFARRALAQDSAQAAAAQLSLVSEDELLPPALLNAPEGLRDSQFTDRYGGVDTANYARAVNWIDRQLAQAR